ncbi:hypothetical protein DRQ32_08890 [bacterium]|nr:MAG: hypothetical protein DRQ32_08890 [bacterium]
MIGHESEFELYHYHESLCSQMVRVGLEEKQLDWTSHPILLSEVARDGDNLTPEYLRINPKGQVPTLVHDGEPVYDSWEIIRYLDRLRPESGVRLVPDDDDLEREIGVWTHEAGLRDDVQFGANLGTAIPLVSAPVIRACLRKLPLWHVMWKFRMHPVPDRRRRFPLARVIPIPNKLLLPAFVTIARALANIEGALSDREDWLLGPFTMVDVMLMAHFHRLEDVALGSVLDHELLPKTAAYWRRLQARPTYQKAILDWHEPHWRSGIDTVFQGQPAPNVGFLEEQLRQALQAG